MSKRQYKPPCTGKETHLSGLEIIENDWHQKSEKIRIARLASIKHTTNTRMEPKFLRNSRVDRKRQMQEVERFTAIERENFRLMDRMSAIMTTQHFKEHVSAICPALDKAKSRQAEQKALADRNEVILQRIIKTRPYYNTKKWDEDNFHHDIQMGYMCKYPRVLPPMYRPGASQKSFESINGALGASPAAAAGAAAAAAAAAALSHRGNARARTPASARGNKVAVESKADVLGEDDVYEEEFEAETAETAEKGE